MKYKKLIGRVDKADFPELGLQTITTKIDTGAYTSSIHCEQITEKDNVLTCIFIDNEHALYHKKIFHFTTYEKVFVRSSNGIMQERFAVQSTIRLFEKEYKITLSLNDRSDMKNPVLLGRKFLSGKFIVDPQLENLSCKMEKIEVYEH